MPVVIFGAGLLLGTLLNIVIIRLPREQNMIGWPPRCTRTGEALAWWQMLPVLGWLLQRGRARNGRPLHWVYPLVELLMGLVLVALHSHYGLAPAFFYLTGITAILLITGAIDWLYRSIYTLVMLGSVPVVLLAGLAVPAIDVLDAGKGLLLGGIGFALLYALARFLFPARAAPFGLGDVYLGIFLGAALGFSRLGSALVYGILMAGAVAAFIVAAKHLARRRDMPEYISYGTYLCLGAILYLVLQEL